MVVMIIYTITKLVWCFGFSCGGRSKFKFFLKSSSETQTSSEISDFSSLLNDNQVFRRFSAKMIFPTFRHFLIKNHFLYFLAKNEHLRVFSYSWRKIILSTFVSKNGLLPLFPHFRPKINFFDFYEQKGTFLTFSSYLDQKSTFRLF